MGRLVVQIVLLVGGLVFVFPLYWMLSTSLKTQRHVLKFPPDIFPIPVQWENYPSAFRRMPFLLFTRNSVIVAILTVIGTVVSCSVIAYAFAKLRFPGRDGLFILVLSTMMVPGIVTLVPTFLLFKEFGWINTLYPLIVPTFFGNAFYIFLLRQFFMAIPNEIIDSARIDGASEWRILRSVVVPMSRPALVATVIFSFQGAWNDFLGPLIFLKETNVRTLAIGLYGFRVMPTMGESFYNELMAATAMVTLPMIVLYIIFQRHFVSGIAISGTGVKG
jgi:multiple sugar transport system permease protein